MTPRRRPHATTICACAGLLAGCGPAAYVLLRTDDPPPRQVQRARPAATPARSAVPAPAPPPQAAAPPAAAPDPGAASPGEEATSWAELPTTLDDPSPDEGEVMTRRLLVSQLVTWLGEEDDAEAALMWAEQVGELAAWSADEDRARLVAMARGDALEARRRAALVALASVAAADPAYTPRLAEAFLARPTAEARRGLEEALGTLQGRGRDAWPLEEALRQAR